MIHHSQDNTKSTLNDSLIFAWKHIRKLYPLYLLTSLSMLPFLYSSMNGEPLPIIKRVAVNLLLIQSWFPQIDIRYSLNNAAWFLSAIAFLYAIFPFICSRLCKIKSKKKLISKALLVALLQLSYSFLMQQMFESGVISFDSMKGLTYNYPLFRVGDFLIGCIAGQVHLLTKQKDDGSSLVSEVLCLLLFIGCCLCREVFCAEDYDWLTTTSLPLLGSVAIIWAFSRKNSIIGNSLSRISAFVYMGDISSAAFLIHQPVIRVIRWASLKTDIIPDNNLFIGLSALFLTMLFSQLWSEYQRKKSNHKFCRA